MIIAGTGHRPDKLGGYSPAALSHLIRFARHRLSLLPEPPSIISGMAQGWDSALAFAALELKLPLTCAIPFIGQERMWPKIAQDLYKDILNDATHVEVVSLGGFSAEKMQIRNEWMVDHCTHVLALWNGSPGGTANCIRYAKQVSKPLANLWPEWLLFT